MFILFSILGWILPIVLVVLIIRAITHRGHKGQPAKGITFRDLILATLGLAAWYAGAAVLYYLPLAVFGQHADNAVFATRLVLGVGLLVAGLMLRHVTGVFLMVVGLTGFALAAPFVFQNLGSGGALLVVAIAFAVLIVFAVRLSRKAEQHG